MKEGDLVQLTPTYAQYLDWFKSKAPPGSSLYTENVIGKRGVILNLTRTPGATSAEVFWEGNIVRKIDLLCLVPYSEEK